MSARLKRSPKGPFPIFLLLAVLMALPLSSGLAFGLPWAKTFGGPQFESANSIQQTSDGGYIVAGASNSFGTLFAQGWVLKLDAAGTTQWVKRYGFGDGDTLNSIQQTSDGGYIVAGSTFLFVQPPKLTDAWIFKLDGNGNVEWSRTFGGSQNDYANSVQQTSDGGYIVAGSSASFETAGGSDAWVFKLNQAGDLVWQQTFGGTADDAANSVQKTSDGGYIVAGTTSSFGAGNQDAWVLKLDGIGTIQWQKAYGGALGDGASSVRQTSDGGYIVAGTTSSFGTGFPYAWVFKLDADGIVEWQKRYGHGDGDAANAVEQTSDGGYIIAGSSYFFVLPSRLNDAWIFKLDGNGNLFWERTFGGSNDDYAYSVRQTSDGGYIVAGETDSFGAGRTDLWIFRTDGNGEIPGCSLMDTSSISSETATNADGISTDAVVSEIFSFPSANPLTGFDTPATVNEPCVGAESFLDFPPDGALFHACSMTARYQPVFEWTPTDTFVRYTLLFSSSADFSAVIYKTSITGKKQSWTPSVSVWKKIMTASANGGSHGIHWKIVGEKADKTESGSEVWSFRVADPQAVVILDPSDQSILSSGDLPTFVFGTNCSIKFALEISPLSDFGDLKRITRFVYSVKDPNIDVTLHKTLSQGQWKVVKKLLGTGPGYFRIKALDALKRETISEVRSFTIR